MRGRIVGWGFVVVLGAVPVTLGAAGQGPLLGSGAGVEPPDGARVTESMTWRATQKVIRDQADWASDVTRFSKLDGGLMQLALDEGGLLQGGYGRFLGDDRYLNAYYEGNVVRLSGTDEEPETVVRRRRESSNFLDLMGGIGTVGAGVSIRVDDLYEQEEDRRAGGEGNCTRKRW